VGIVNENIDNLYQIELDRLPNFCRNKLGNIFFRAFYDCILFFVIHSKCLYLQIHDTLFVLTSRLANQTQGATITR
jgi:hypothetical protein